MIQDVEGRRGDLIERMKKHDIVKFILHSEGQ